MLSRVTDWMKLKFMRSAKISIKLTAMYAIMFSLLLLFLNASILYGTKYYFYSQAYNQIESYKGIILNKVIPSSEHRNLSDKGLISDVPLEQNVSIRMLTQNGSVLNESSGFHYNVNTSGPYNTIKHLEENEKHLAYETIMINTTAYGPVYIQIVKNLVTEYYFMKILFLFMAAADFTGIIISIISGYIFSKRMLKPIDNITRAAEKISINNLKERIDVDGPEDELKRLGNTFNNMIDGLQSSFDRQTQFVSDASHELRTPIAVIQGYANLLDRWGKYDKEALEKSIGAIKLEADNMADLVEKLLFLARSDNSSEGIEKQPLQLNLLIDEVVRESALIYKDHAITSSKNDTVNISADYRMLKQMLRIFIDNSVKFSPKNSIIDISSEISGKNVRITISDMGAGIAKDEIEKIFDRFYTVDKSRSREKGGTGLGLSIAKRIADMHQGTIAIESEQGKYTKVIVSLYRLQ